ncbi:glycosyltransferase [Saccharibacillus sp. CPCC 101409]|uniref:glycosyltransferase family 2 protein n=1 Tax=Saccharibacillus sp. CPCC 101409 TaxID=3058041 RepID=UPI00267153BB|nr:glycosyltransferase [Saccharibacillus sp. CPCC 101409]MDO3409948.1 glycosyltransferase [Saccharibacillus sp. CPCC 101409]
MSDILLLLSIISIWLAVFEAILIMAGATRFIYKERRRPWSITGDTSAYPTVTVLVPAHNEELVIAATAENVLKLNYPAEKVQFIVIADNCSDATAEKLCELKSRPDYAQRDFTVLERTGTGGKSGALNDAFELARGEWVCIYDADAAPEKNALLFLVQTALENPQRYGAVFGRNKARNRGQNFLSRCVNLELVTAQRIYHAGLWQLFKVGTIPGTNFMIKAELLREIGGWDTDAITEDTAISFEILRRGQLIALASRAEAYQQEPESLDVYAKQRRRWAKGNFDVVLGNLHHLFDRTNWRVKIQVIYYAASYFWFMAAILISDFIFIVNLVYRVIHWFRPEVYSPFQFSGDVYVYLVVAWGLMYYLYVLQINLALATDIGQSNTRNFILSCISYFTYAQLFILISIRALGEMIVDRVTGRKAKWYKTQRFG